MLQNRKIPFFVTFKYYAGRLSYVKDITDYLTKDQVNELLEVAAIHSVRDYLMIRILWRTGMRISELLNMKPSHIEFETRSISIPRTKFNKQRRVLLDQQTLELIEDYIKVHNIRRSQPIIGITRQHAHRLINHYGKLIGVDIHPHTLRHSFAINMVRSNVDIRRVQQLMGHSSLSGTQVYLKFNNKDILEAYDRVDF